MLPLALMFQWFQVPVFSLAAGRERPVKSKNETLTLVVAGSATVPTPIGGHPAGSGTLLYEDTIEIREVSYEVSGSSNSISRHLT